jgi:IclR family transcriptional regulator, KDG regulon repressor
MVGIKPQGSRREMLGTVDKAARVLALFTDEKAEWGVSEVGRAMDLPKSSAHSLVAALAAAGFLVRTPENRYRLGWQMLRLSRVLLDSSPALRYVRPTVQTLVARYGVTAHVAGLDRGEIIYLLKARGAQAVPSITSEVGRRSPAHATALGKMLLAHASEATLESEVLGRGLTTLAYGTITSPDRLRQEIKLARERGWAQARHESTADLCCYAAPVFDRERRVEAAISVSVSVAEDAARPGHYARLALAAGRCASKALIRAESESWKPFELGRQPAAIAA